MEVTIDTSQIKELQKFFEVLSKDDQRKILISSLRKSVRPMVSTAVNLAPLGKTGNVRRAISVREVKDDIAISVGLDKRGWYGVFSEPTITTTNNERFWKKRKGKDGGRRSTGIMTRRPFIIPAYEHFEEQIKETVTRDYYLSIDAKIKAINNKLK